MRLLLAITIASSAFVSFAIVPREDLPKALANRNTEGVGAMSNDVLAVALEAKQSLWYPYGENHAGVSNAAFAEEGKAPSVPGPLIHVASLPHVNVLEGRTRGQLDFSLSFAKTEPSMRFVLEEGTHRIEAGTAFSPTMVLTRGEPVSITVVNHLDEPTSVHWHGIELDSYNDGVAGVSGSGAHLAPLIAPRESFEVRFTPPRTGTFMYHSLLMKFGSMRPASLVH